MDVRLSSEARSAWAYCRSDRPVSRGPTRRVLHDRLHSNDGTGGSRQERGLERGARRAEDDIAGRPSRLRQFACRQQLGTNAAMPDAVRRGWLELRPLPAGQARSAGSGARYSLFASAAQSSGTSEWIGAHRHVSMVIGYRQRSAAQGFPRRLRHRLCRLRSRRHHRDRTARLHVLDVDSGTSGHVCRTAPALSLPAGSGAAGRPRQQGTRLQRTGPQRGRLPPSHVGRPYVFTTAAFSRTRGATSVAKRRSCSAESSAGPRMKPSIP
jgi:hypothetical protein